MADAVTNNDVGAFGIEPAVDHRPVDRVHQVGAHQAVDVGEFLFEDMSPLRRSDRFVHTTQLPGRDGLDVPRHQPQFVLEAGDRVGVGAGYYTQQQRAVDGAGLGTATRRFAPVAGAVDASGRRVAQRRLEICFSGTPLVFGVEAQMHQDVAAV